MDSIDKAAEMLFGTNGMGVKNIRFFPGSSADVTPEQRAEELINIFQRVRDGDFDVVEKNFNHERNRDA